MKMNQNPYREEIKQYLINQFGLPPEQIDSMLPELIGTLVDHIKKLETVVEIGEPEQLGKAGHTIKGALLNLGLTDCAEIAHSIETAGKGGVSDVDYQELVLAIRQKLTPYIG